jgi:anti-anti-sigma factor
MDRAASEPAAWSAPPEFNIVNAAQIHAQLSESLPALSACPRVDLSEVAEFDSSGVQILLALRASLAAEGQTLTLQGASPVVRDALKTFGLDDHFSSAAVAA